MAEDGGGDGGGGAGGSLLISDMSVLIMDDVLHKLHCLNYEADYCLPKDITPFHKLYFAVPAAHSGLQFSNFISLVSFLLGKCRRNFGVEKMEDPNSVLTRLVGEVRGLGMPEEVQPLKLRAGYGEAPVRVLNFLCDKAMEMAGWHWERPQYGEGVRGGAGAGGDGDMVVDEEEGLEGAGGGGGIGEDTVEDEGDDGDDEISERDAAHMPGAGDDDDAEGDLASLRVGGAGAGSAGAPSSPDGGAGAAAAAAGAAGGRGAAPGILEASLDAAQWRAEAERAGNKIKPPSLAGGGREWRSHLEQTHGAEGSISRSLPDVRGGLDKLAASLADTLASVAAKERFLHASVKGLATEYAEAAGSAEEVSTAYAAASGRVGALTSELNAVSEALEEVRGTMDEKGSSMTDTSPLIRVKAALTALRAESRTFDLHIGVVGHAVLHSKVSHKVGGGAGPAGSSGGGGAKGRGGSFSKADVDVTGSGSDEDEDA